MAGAERVDAAGVTVWLSAMRYALALTGSSSATCTGTFLRPRLCAAFQRVCPTMITPSASTTIGWRKPNSWRLRATAATAASLSLGFFS